VPGFTFFTGCRSLPRYVPRYRCCGVTLPRLLTALYHLPLRVYRCRLTHRACYRLRYVTTTTFIDSFVLPLPVDLQLGRSAAVRSFTIHCTTAACITVRVALFTLITAVTRSCVYVHAPAVLLPRYPGSRGCSTTLFCHRRSAILPHLLYRCCSYAPADSVVTCTGCTVL